MPKDCQYYHYQDGHEHHLGCVPSGADVTETLADFLPSKTIKLELTQDEYEILFHFASVGQSYVIQRNNFGDRKVAQELEPVLHKIHSQSKGR